MVSPCSCPGERGVWAESWFRPSAHANRFWGSGKARGTRKDHSQEKSAPGESVRRPIEAPSVARRSEGRFPVPKGGDLRSPEGSSPVRRRARTLCKLPSQQPAGRDSGAGPRPVAAGSPGRPEGIGPRIPGPPARRPLAGWSEAGSPGRPEGIGPRIRWPSEGGRRLAREVLCRPTQAGWLAGWLMPAAVRQMGARKMGARKMEGGRRQVPGRSQVLARTYVRRTSGVRATVSKARPVRAPGQIRRGQAGRQAGRQARIRSGAFLAGRAGPEDFPLDPPPSRAIVRSWGTPPGIGPLPHPVPGGCAKDGRTRSWQSRRPPRRTAPPTS